MGLRNHKEGCSCAVCERKRFQHPVLFKQKFGRLTVTGPPFQKLLKSGGRTRVFYPCVCDCGIVKDVEGSLLRDGVQSCGCLRIERAKVVNSKPHYGKELNIVLYSYRDNAKRRNLIWALTDEQATQLVLGSCHYCGLEPSILDNKLSGKFNGIDRMHNGPTYSLGECVSCCSQCNIAKMNRTYEDFMAYLQRVAKFHSSSRPMGAANGV